MWHLRGIFYDALKVFYMDAKFKISRALNFQPFLSANISDPFFRKKNTFMV